jgi:RNA polymerase sigma-70 factor (ECF subfamily)
MMTDSQPPLADQFPAFVEATQQRLLRLAGKMLREPADAEDVVNEAYFRLWQALQTGQEIRSPTGWLVFCVRNLARDALRRRRATVSDPDTVASPDHGPDRLAELRLDVAVMLVAAAACGPRAVEIFRRIKGEGEPAASVAAEFGISRRQAYHATESVTDYLRRRFAS